MTQKPFGIMFHHFRGEGHPDGQGAITENQLNHIIRNVGRKRILGASEWSSRVQQGTLPDDAICITFDDNLRCQFDVAWPVLKRHSIEAFWFIYSGPLCGSQEKLEIFRYFRSVAFSTFDAFYSDFFDVLSKLGLRKEVDRKLQAFNPAAYLAEFPFYTDTDRKFRYTRDWILTASEYDSAMYELMRIHNFSKDGLSEKLWMNSACLRELASHGQIIGLHSHTHPTQIARLSREEKYQEYHLNFTTLQNQIGIRPSCMAHPCNSYDEETLEILRAMNILMGFRSNMHEPIFGRPLLELPRNDHMNVLRDICD